MKELWTVSLYGRDEDIDIYLENLEKSEFEDCIASFTHEKKTPLVWRNKGFAQLEFFSNFNPTLGDVFLNAGEDIPVLIVTYMGDDSGYSRSKGELIMMMGRTIVSRYEYGEIYSPDYDSSGKVEFGDKKDFKSNKMENA